MKAHELNANCFYRAERRCTIKNITLTDVVFAAEDGECVAVRFCRFVGMNPLAWDYFGPLTLQSGKEAAEMLKTADASVADSAALAVDEQTVRAG